MMFPLEGCAFIGEAQRVVALLMLLRWCQPPLSSAPLFGRRVEESRVHAEEPNDWTSSETTDSAQAIWLPSLVCYITRDAVPNQGPPVHHRGAYPAGRLAFYRPMGNDMFGNPENVAHKCLCLWSQLKITGHVSSKSGIYHISHVCVKMAF